MVNNQVAANTKALKGSPVCWLPRYPALVPHLLSRLPKKLLGSDGIVKNRIRDSVDRVTMYGPASSKKLEGQAAKLKTDQ